MGPAHIETAGPGIAEPERWQQVQLRWVWPPVHDLYADQQVFSGGFAVLDEHIKIAVVVKHPSIDQFKLERVAATATVLFDQPGVGEFGLGIFVEILQVRMGRCGVKIEVILLDILAMIPFAARQPKEPFLENRIATIP